MAPGDTPGVPFQDFVSPYLELQSELDEAYHRFMRSGWYVLGKEVASFEDEYAAYCQAGYCVGLGNGLEALHLALLAIGVGPGDEVIVPSNTYIATWLAVTHAGAVPVPVEPDIETYNIDPRRIQEAITPRTKVILAVNLYGQPCDYESLLRLARERGLKVVIDNAQAQGAKYEGRTVGGIADIECHSFYPSKNLGAHGEAGAITTNDPQVADQVRVLRNYGSRVRYYNEMIGYNSRLDELQAAFLRVKLRHLDSWNLRRRDVARMYLADLAGLPESTPSVARLALPQVPDWVDPVWHLFVIRCSSRDALRSHLEEKGIKTLIHYPVPPHQSGAYKHRLGKVEGHPIAELLANTVLSLPIGPHLSADGASAVTAAVREFFIASR